MSNDIETTESPAPGVRPNSGRKRAILVGAGLAAVLALTGTGIAVASEVGDDGADEALTGSTLEQASAAALAEADGGEVVEAERDGTGYEVEVLLPDGQEVDVQLDENFAVVASETEAADPADDADDADDANDPADDTDDDTNDND